jgi:hypothetical protein
LCLHVGCGCYGCGGVGWSSRRGGVPDLPSRSILVCFSAASAYMIASASRHDPVSYLALAELSFASVACRYLMALRGSVSLGVMLHVAGALPLS